MTYFLEKTYELDDDGHLVASRYCSTLIRPCEWEYSKILDWHAGRLSRKDDVLTLGGQVASFNDNLSQDSRRFDSIEEWLIWLELNKGIVPDFEETRIQTRDHLKEYTAKSIDLHADKVLFDAMADTIELVKKLDFRCRS